MDCREFNRLIWEELDGNLAGARMHEFSQHRQHCASCEREYLKQRRVKLYIRCFPTVGNISDKFRSELLYRVRNGNLRSHYRLSYPRVTVTLAMFMFVLLGLLFAVNSYREYIVQSRTFIAQYPEGYEAVKSVLVPSPESELRLSREPPLYALNLQHLRAEDFVLKLLANYQNGEVSEQLVTRLAVETGLLEGVSMELPERNTLTPFARQSTRIVVRFPHSLPSQVMCQVERADLIELRKFTLDVFSTYGPGVKPPGPGMQPTVGMRPSPGLPPKPEDNKEDQITDVIGAGFDASLVPDGVMPLMLEFAPAQEGTTP
ncbi:MAG: hypothetical protein A2Y63_03235 [Candidatus Riflebacteria bacterium RBG_13_59_9]|nr:MAG: hypothetical protein A2Y63_03235 [Candidatus Riflebacteria bacterium RBG_13_59_9]